MSRGTDPSRRLAYYVGLGRVETAGQRAFDAGKAEKDCPYGYRHSASYRQAWMRGFNEAKLEAALQAYAKAASNHHPDQGV